MTHKSFPPTHLRRILARKFIAVAAAGLLSACATMSTPPPVPEEIPVPVVSEGDARIYRVREIRSSKDLGATPGFWGSIWKLVIGEQETAVVRPYGVYADGSGRILIADPGLGSVHVFDRADASYRTIYTGKERGAKASPIGITGDGTQNIWFSDSADGRIMHYAVGSRNITPFVESLSRPTGIAFNNTNGLLYVAETGTHEVVAFDASGTEKMRFGGRGDEPGKFNYPTDISSDARGRIYVTDALNARIQVFSPEGTLLHYFGSPGDTPGHFAKPKGIATDPRGLVYVADALFDAIQVFDAEGTLLMAFGKTGTAPGEFWMPTGMYVDKAGLIYVADSYNRRIQVFRIDLMEEEP